MIEHCVFCAIPATVSKADLADVMNRLGSLKEVVQGMVSFRSGPNRDYENKSGNYTYGFVCTFRDRQAHLAYESHPVHQAAGRDLVALCEGGYDGIIVFDLEVPG
jgi:Stress responsive A/B Barrel Domain